VTVVEDMEVEGRGEAFARGIEGSAGVVVEAVEVERGGRSERVALGVIERGSVAMLAIVMLCRVLLHSRCLLCPPPR